MIYACLGMLAAVWPPSGSAQDEPPDPAETAAGNDGGNGSFTFGYFVIDNINSRLYLGPDDTPLAARVDFNRDLGLKDSASVLRLAFRYTFGNRHGISLGYYDFDNAGDRILARTIRLGESEFDIGDRISSRYEEKILKIGYNLLFHDDGKIMLAVTPGIHFSSIDFRITAPATAVSADREEGGSATAPLPMIGGRLRYRITPKLAMDVQSDIFFLNQSAQTGSLTDSYLSFEHQTFEKIAFGAGLNRWALDIDFTSDGERWDWQSIYTGAYLYMRVLF
jgi:hypothetical protein